MATPYTQSEIRRLAGMFDIYGDFLVGTPFGNGNVNDTFQLTVWTDFPFFWDFYCS